MAEPPPPPGLTPYETGIYIFKYQFHGQEGASMEKVISILRRQFSG